jgi:hypothetical protein
MGQSGYGGLLSARVNVDVRSSPLGADHLYFWLFLVESKDEDPASGEASVRPALNLAARQFTRGRSRISCVGVEADSGGCLGGLCRFLFLFFLANGASSEFISTAGFAEPAARGTSTDPLVI